MDTENPTKKVFMEAKLTLNMIDQQTVFDIEMQEEITQKTQSGVFEILRPKQSLTENLNYLANDSLLETNSKPGFKCEDH